MSRIETLDVLRHVCHGCGGSCSGHRVRLLEGEAEALLPRAAALGVAQPLDGDRLREIDGACVFLSERGCALHARFGAASKPRVCQQFPVLAVRVEDGLRLGLDPGCLTTWRSWRTGPEIEVDSAIVSPAPYDEATRASEAGLLALTGAPDATVARLLGTLSGEDPEGEALPAGFADRWCRLLLRAPLVESLGRHGQAPVFHRHLSWLLAALDGALVEGQPPAWPLLGAEADAFAVEVTRRMVFLRLGWRRGPPPAIALATLAGAVTCAWGLEARGELDEDRWAMALAVWTRAIRSDIFWRSIFPEPRVLRWLVTG